jgi:hypothetical protein
VRAGLAAALLALGLGSAPAAARELWRSGDAHLDVSGSTRELLVGSHGTDADAFTRDLLSDPACLPAASFPDCAAWDALNQAEVIQSLTRLRIRLEGRANEHLWGEIDYDNELTAGDVDTLGREIGKDFAGDTLWRADQDIVDTENLRWRHLLYRAYLVLEWQPLELVLGRQRVPWGVGRLWNPIDRFNPIPPLALEADQSPGVDAATLRWRFSGFSFLELVLAPLRDPEDGSYAARLHGVLHDVDYSLVAGVFEQAPTVGFDLAGNLGEAAARLEVVWSDPTRKVWRFDTPAPRELPAFWQVVASVDHLFDLGTGLYVLLEHLYNGNALGFGRGRAGPLLGFFEETRVPPVSDPPLPGPYWKQGNQDLFGGSRVVSFAEQQTGLQLGYDLTGELRGELLLLYDWDGSSAAFFPAFHYSPLDWLELSLGAQLFTGPKRSQFGDLEPLGFLLVEAFF